MMPRYGFYEAHLNAYNRDTWVEVPEGTSGGIRFEDGKFYKEYQPGKVPAGQSGTKESLNGELNNYQFSARAVIDRYKKTICHWDGFFLMTVTAPVMVKLIRWLAT